MNRTDKFIVDAIEANYKPPAFDFPDLSLEFKFPTGYRLPALNHPRRQSMEVLSISPLYFRLRRPLERRLYEIAGKHVGTKNKSWKIGIEKLQAKVGTNAALKKFRFNLKEIIRDDNIPDYGFMLDGNNVIMQRLVSPDELVDHSSFIKLRPDTYDKAQKIAAQLRVSVFDLEREWNEWAAEKGATINSPDGGFFCFC